MIGTLLYFSGFFLISSAAYLNQFDQPLNFQCPKSTQTISRIQSIHDNGPEDRRFDLSCKDFLVDDSGVTPVCYWTDWLNTYDGLVHFSCPNNDYISGMSSVHDNGSEDRRWKIYCCQITDVHMSDCTFSGWTNEYDKEQDYTVPQNKVLKGMISNHDNGPEDRIFEYEYCGFYHEGNEPVVG